MMDTNHTSSAVMERPGRIAPRRPVKLQICLTREERVQLTEGARAAGFDSVAAFVRWRTLGPAA